uniref:Uncharacterized protein n=1 Tax=Opuntia streptacantha TaxID=393608 RepID=A0A7C9CQS5_OPUST
MKILSEIRRPLLTKDVLIRDLLSRLNLLHLEQPMGSMSSAPPQGTVKMPTMEVVPIEDMNIVEIGTQHHKKTSSIILRRTERGRGRLRTMSTRLLDHITTPRKDLMSQGQKRIIKLELE